MRRRSWIALGLVVVALGIGLWLWLRRDRPHPARTHNTPRARKLDVAAFRAQVIERVQRARQLAARNRAAAPPPVQSGPWKMQGTGKFTVSLRKELLEPQCTLGPGEVCDLLIPLIDGCDEGDARDCLAVGQYLQDGPPLPVFATAFFLAACKIGDAAGCERLAEVMSKDPVPCASDPFRCSFLAARTHDHDLLDEACSLGAAGACVTLGWELRADPEIERAYTETACQLGEAAVCAELGRRLAPGCEPSENMPCYDPDPEQARAALEIGCRAGWGDKARCDALNLP